MTARPDIPLRKPVTPAIAPPKSDPGEWAWDHRAGLCVTVIVYLLAAIAFMSVKVFMGARNQPEVIYIDVMDERELVQMQQQQEQLRQLAGEQLTGVKNLVSNTGAQDRGAGGSSGNSPDERGLNSALRDAKGTDAQEIYDQAAAALEGSAANRRAYEEGLRRAAAIGTQNASGSGKAAGAGGDVKVQGNVTVSFTLIKPLRTSVYLFVPAYQCEGGGEIAVAVTVNRSGEVTAATPSEWSASVDECMTRAAVGAALNSRFNADPSAPEKQKGTITYIFVPQ